MQHTRPQVVAATALVSVLALVGGTIGAVSPAAAASAPSDLRVAGVSANAIALTWDKMGQDAYRVRFSSSPGMESPRTWDVVGNYAEWNRIEANPTLSAPRLSPGATYYFQVKAVVNAASSGARTDLSSYTKPVAVTTAVGAFPELAPVGMKATVGGADSLYLSWRTRGPGLDYRLRYTTNPSADITDWATKDFDADGGTLSGLAAGTTYYFRVRVIDRASGTALSDYSDTWSKSTQASTTSPGIAVVSYNIRKPGGSPSWEARRIVVANAIKAQSPDVVALQEATPVTVTGAGGARVRQYADILNLLGGKYEYVTYEASSGTRLAYDTTRFSVVAKDAVKLYKKGKSPRYAVWAILKDKVGGKQFFVINTHLEPGSNKSSKLNKARVKQAKQVLGLIGANAKGRPVIITGDMNASRSTKPNNGPYIQFTGAGMIDPLDNRTTSWSAGQNSIVENLVDPEYNSYNGYARTARRTPFAIGTNVDYILVSRGIRVALWRTVVNLNTSGQFLGTIPADHNMVTATIHLP